MQIPDVQAPTVSHVTLSTGRIKALLPPARHPINELQVSMAEMGDTCTSASRNKHANMYLIKMVLG